jgi:RNA polymerase sigma factor (sigma-70 family)
VRLRTLQVRHVVQLRETAQGRKVSTMDARALMGALTGEHGRFVRLARLRVANEADAEDVVQRALMRASERAASLEDPTRARAWFYRILRHAIADHHRARPEDPMRHQDATDVAELASEDAPARTPCTCSVRLLDELRPGYADVIRRVDMNGEAPAAVARALGISLGNLHVRHHRARRILREDVRHYCGVASHRPCLDCACDRHHRCGHPAHRSE